jgi:cytochrome c556
MPMRRKWTTLAATVVAVCLTASAFTFADDDDSPLHKLMEKVSAKNNAIGKGVRTLAAYKKAQKDLPGLADELIKLGKESRDATEPAKKQKKSQGEWVKLSDDFVKKTEEFKALVSKADTKQAEAKSAHNVVKASCTACHNVFKVEEDQ